MKGVGTFVVAFIAAAFIEVALHEATFIAAAFIEVALHEATLL
jgi:hypothetical protein